MKIRKLESEMLQTGFFESFKDTAYSRIDKEQAEKIVCKCGTKMQYRGYRSPSSYVAFAVCEACGNTMSI